MPGGGAESGIAGAKEIVGTGGFVFCRTVGDGGGGDREGNGGLEDTT